MVDAAQSSEPQSRHTSVALLFSGIAGLVLVIAGFKVAWLNWVVDVPGSIVARFISIDFHEGDGIAGLLIALVLSWLCSSAAVFLLGRFLWRGLALGKLRARNSQL